MYEAEPVPTSCQLTSAEARECHCAPVFCASVIGIPCEIVSPRRVAELHPLLNVHDLVGAMHVPEDAVVSSADVALALASAASQNGEWARGGEDGRQESAAWRQGTSQFLRRNCGWRL